MHIVTENQRLDMNKLPVLNDAQRDLEIGDLEQRLAEAFNCPFLYLSHVIGKNDQGRPALFVHITDLDTTDQKVSYDLFFSAYDQLTAAYQTQIDLFIKSAQKSHWDVPKIK